ncbi:hypothetical protein [Qipengyuania citrea]|uniref:hypothetical protein n=1 Tax=Qipengyuania citrea TaxID=225971 RepID=UPI00329873C6
MSDWSNTDSHSVNYIDTQSINDRGAPQTYNPSNYYDATTPLGMLNIMADDERLRHRFDDFNRVGVYSPFRLRDLAVMVGGGILGAILLSLII